MLGVEKDIAIIPEPMLLPSDIEGPWSYVAMGHIHKRQPFGLGESTLGGYCGSIDRMNFGEEGEPKGGWIYEDGKLSPFDTPARTFITVDLDTVSFTELEQDPEGAIIRIRGSYDEWADKAEVARKLFLDNGAALVRVDLQRTARVAIRSAAASDAPGPLEALDVYLEHREVPEDDRPPIRSRARDLVGGAA
jgi:DNA repair exonuclease SbcCD nuclease subunit